MATPPNAIAFGDSMDPAEELDWIAPLSSMLEEGESVESGYTIALSPEALDAGLFIMTGDGRDHHLITGQPPIADNTAILAWLAVEPGSQADPMFDGAGTEFPIEITFHTNSVPSRKRQRTFVLRVAQR